MEITVLIAEDDPVMRHILRKALSELPDLVIVSEAKNGLETMQMIKEFSPQVVFLDIYMPEKNGLEIARDISNIFPKTIIVFATAYENFAHEAFEVYAFDYLIKPYRIDRINKTIERIRVWLSNNKVENISNVSGNSKKQPGINSEIIKVKKNDSIVFINITDIVFITREFRNIIIHSKVGNFKTVETLESLEQKLVDFSFLRCHRGFIINLKMVKELQPWGRKTFKVVMNNTSETILMTKTKAMEIENILAYKQ